MTPQPDKVEWPELVGKPGEAAKSIIAAQRPDVKVSTCREQGARAGGLDTHKADACCLLNLFGNLCLQVFVVPAGSAATMDYRTDRVRVWVDPEGQVAQTPMVG